MDNRVEKIKEFYQRKFGWVPEIENLPNDIGHFNVFRLDPFVEKEAKAVPYKRRDYFKINLVIGNGKVQYADKEIEVQKQALAFANPLIPYKWEQLDRIRRSFYCIFTRDFFHQFGNINQYSVFQPNGQKVFELSDEQKDTVISIYERMFKEINSDYVHKYDVLRNLVFELVHFAMKMQPSDNFVKQKTDANKKIARLFLELLERQFPIDGTHQKVKLRSPSDFANQLNIHVNHLNRALKETYNKTTSQIIAERLLQESKILLKHSDWYVSDIAYSLGFTEVTHFNNFFKQHLRQNPLKFRNV